MLLLLTLLAGACRAAPPAPSTLASTPTTDTTATTSAGSAPATSLLPLQPAPTGVCDAYAEPQAVATVADERLREVSGIVRSRAHPGTTWMHNDSGDGAVVYAVDETGRTTAAYNLGILTLDPEDLALGPGVGGDALYLADVGDNFAFRPIISVYRFPEPDPAGGELGEVERIDLAFPDGPVDAEAVAIDPVTGDLLLVTKTTTDPALVYRAPAAELIDGGTVDLEALAELDLGAQVTALDLSPNGDRLAMRGYHEIWLWPRTDVDLAPVLAAAPCLLTSPDERQGESIAFDPDGSLFTVSEGAGPAVFKLAKR